MSEKILQLNEENYQGANQGIGPRQRGGNAERAVGTRGGVTDATSAAFNRGTADTVFLRKPLGCLFVLSC